MSELSLKSKFVNAVLAILFFAFAYLQLNDPDPLVWFSIYGLVGLFFLIALFRGVPIFLLYLTLSGLLLFALYHLPYFYEWMSSDHKEELFGEMKQDRYYIEGTREFLGLLIAFGALLFLLRQTRLRQIVK